MRSRSSIAEPLAADWFAVSCEAIHASTSTGAAPACHHAQSRLTRMSGAPKSCGHDHQGVVALAAADTSAGARTPIVALAPAFSISASMMAIVATTNRGSPRIDPSVASIPLTLSSSLRI
jgi:hypothetical protein